MLLNLVRFNFKSADLDAEERNYLGHHVALAMKLPGLRLYYTGRLLEVGGEKPDRYRAAVLAFDSTDASSAAMRTEAGAALAADGQAHLTALERRSADAEVIVPFDSRRAGQPCFIMAAEFDLATDGGGIEAAETRYRDHHVAIARRLPGLRNYIIGKLAPAGGGVASRYRLAVLAFDSPDALRDAYRSPVGRDLAEDERATIRNPRVTRLDARVEV